METTDKDMAYMFSYLDKAGAKFTVDTNPSEEKVSRITAAIERKNQLLKRFADNYIKSKNISIIG